MMQILAPIEDRTILLERSPSGVEVVDLVSEEAAGGSKAKKVVVALLALAIVGAVVAAVLKKRGEATGKADGELQVPAAGPGKVEGLLDPAAAADVLDVTEAQIDAMVAQGMLTPVGEHGERRFDAAEVQAARLAGG